MLIVRETVFFADVVWKGRETSFSFFSVNNDCSLPDNSTGKSGLMSSLPQGYQCAMNTSNQGWNLNLLISLFTN